MSDPDHYDDYDDGGICCPRCSGMGSVDCHCGGDLCVCENYGDAPCPLCDGEGEVSEATYQKYEEARAKAWEEWQAVVAKGSDT